MSSPSLTGLHMLLGHEATRLQLEVDGTIKAARDDRCLRIGLNPIGAPLAAAHRWFPSSKGLRSDCRNHLTESRHTLTEKGQEL